jgi:3-keto-5-aminohexanoate cleavage enzyme
MDPLIITATPNNCWLHPELPYPGTASELVAEGRRCQDAGAHILHMHSDDWPNAIPLARSETDLIVQCGLSALQIPERMDVFELRADLIAIITSHHDEAFVEQDFHVLHPREELAEYARLSRQYGTRLEFEIWHTGSIWNLNWLIERDLVDPPYFTSVFFGWPGGSWSPPTVEEYLYRRKHMPEGSIVTVSVMDPRQLDVLAAAIIHGDHIRVGTEDLPFDRAGNPAGTPRLVEEAVELAQALGRPLATIEEARRLTGVGPVPITSTEEGSND